MTAAVLGAISVKGRPPLPRPTNLTTDSADLVDVSAPFTVRHEPSDTWGYEMPPFARLVLPAPLTDPALRRRLVAGGWLRRRPDTQRTAALIRADLTRKPGIEAQK